MLDAADLAQLAFSHYVPDVMRRARNVSPAWNAVSAYLKQTIVEVFASEGQTSEHPRWAELSDRPVPFHRDHFGHPMSYADWKMFAYPGRGILELTGKLKRQLTRGEAGGGHEEFHPTRYVLGSDYETYAGVPGRPRPSPPHVPHDRTNGHDIGGVLAEGRRGRYEMPARMPIRLTARNVRNVADMVMDWVLEGDVPDLLP